MQVKRSTVLNIAVVCSVLLAVGISIRTLRVQAMGHYLASQHYEAVYYVPPPQWLPVFSLGHHEALADLLWTRALVYFGEELQHQGQVKHLFNYVDAMLTLDPYFREVYRWVGNAALYRTGTVTANDARQAARYLERGVGLFPADGELAWDLGATLAYELPPLLTDPAQKADAKQRGVQHLQTAALLGAGPSWLVLTNASELRRLGKTEQALRHLEEAYATIRDPDTRAQIEKQLATFRSQAYAEAFRLAVQQTEQERQTHFPYLPTSLYLLVGQRLQL